jgi:hypothetical protein
MSKITLALGSLIVGLLVGSLFLGSHTVTFAQPAPVSAAAQYINPGQGASGVELHLMPQVPGIGPKINGLHIMGLPQTLDGLNCDGCEFVNATLRYSGGAVALNNASFKGTTRVELSGPAANTVALLPLLSALAAGKKPEPPSPNLPIIKTEMIATQMNLSDWQTPFQK